MGESALDAVTMIHWDFRFPAEPNLVKELSDVTHILHLGAESHVDNSITDPQRFVDSNITGTVNIMQLARQLPNLSMMNLFSTDEVFGPAPMKQVRVVEIDGEPVEDGPVFSLDNIHGFKETDRHNPKNPYAATKSSAEMMAIAFANTYKIPIFITNGMNIIGERQHREKFLPLVINKALHGGLVEIHGTADKTQAGMRTYIHARNVADALLYIIDQKEMYWEDEIMTKGEVESYNIVGEEELDNLTFAKLIAEYTQIVAAELDIVAEGCEFEIVDFHSQRPGHDLRYALDGTKLKNMGWEPPKTLRDSLRKTIKWYLENPEWLRK
jgi:dTDP-glucose 4,6-dehydratase